MNLLAIDTCFAACSVAVGLGLGSDAASTEELYEPLETGHAERLMPLIEEVMNKAGIGFDALDRIAVTTGPGTFTGTRIGLSAAKGLALAARLPLTAVSSLAVMAKSSAIDRLAMAPGTVLAITVDGRRGQVYAQLFDRSGGSEKTPPVLLSIDEAAQLGGSGRVVFAGTGAQAVAAAAVLRGRSASAQGTALQPNIGDYIRTAAELTPVSGPVKPLYLRPPDAKAQTNKTIKRAT